MLAYVFWHRPRPQTERSLYEAAIMRFQRDLARQQPPGFISATSFAIAAVPWLSDHPGYEDWYLVAGSWALDPLNAYAIAGAMQSPHDSVAAQMEEGHGGLYAHAGGEAVMAPRSAIYWMNRPRGISWQPPIAAVLAGCPRANAWRRQMVLGRAAEFAVEVPGDAAIDVPPAWDARRVERVRLLEREQS